MKKQGGLSNFLVGRLNGINLSKKLVLMQIFCVILPLVVTDLFILGIVVSSERRSVRQEMTNTADAVQYMMTDRVNAAALLAHNIYSNRYVNEFMAGEFASDLDFYDRKLDFIKNSLYPLSITTSFNNAVIYAENPGIVDGGYFKKVNQVEQKDWYRNLMEGSSDIIVGMEYSQRGDTYNKIFFLAHKMDYYHKGKSKNVLQLELDYSGIESQLLNAKYNSRVCVCRDDVILFSNDGKGGVQTPFRLFEPGEDIGEAAVSTLNFYGNEYTIYVFPPELEVQNTLIQYMPMILLLILANVLLPYALMKLINQSLTRRLSQLRDVFGAAHSDELSILPEIVGNDEISELMKSYNVMAARMNDLIQTVFKNKLYQQEIDLARQNAELLALRSQINPHFLFNALESIRMHSVLKHENETADMVEKLALMQRQNVDWGQDLVTVREEVSFIRAYLELQQYRFGEKLAYNIEIEEACMGCNIPKLTLVTFVENACVHGIEGKPSAGWIFLRGTYRGGVQNKAVFEIEDTGMGMSEDMCEELQEHMNHVRIDMIKESSHVGILNAALRLKMLSKGRAAFTVESEEGVGTIVTIEMILD